jgi:uroporphyrinogen III methyltransferase/synthase
MSLAGKRVLLARAEGQNESPARLLRERFAEPVIIPSIAIGPPDDEGALQRALARARDFDWVVFTSANGVERTWITLAALGEREDVFGAARFAVVGSATRDALEAHGPEAQVVAKEFRGEGVAAALIEAIQSAPASGTVRRVLILRAHEASDVLPEALVAAGVEVVVIAAYRTRALPVGVAEIKARLEAGTLDVVIFSSGSTVDALCDAFGSSSDAAPRALAPCVVACIGPLTAAAARGRGIRVDVVPSVATFTEVIAALESRFRAI